MNARLHNYRKTKLYIEHGEGYGLWFSFRALPAVVGLVIVLLLLSISPARSEELSLNGVQAGQMLLRSQGGGVYEPALIQRAKVHFDISGMLAVVSLEQSFRNNGDQWVEGIYAFPLPDQAAVRQLEMIIGDRRIQGKIREKSIAKKIYQAAERAGKKASLVEQVRPNLFTNAVANIGPGEEITVRLEYVQPVAYVGGEFSLRFPMTITPRYMPVGAPRRQPQESEPALETLKMDDYMGWALPSNQHVKGLDLNRIEITARLNMGMPLANIEANYHEIVLSRNKGLYDIHLVSGTSEMDRDFVMHWRPVTGSAPGAAVFTEQVGGDHYGLLMLVPPELADSSTEVAIAREMIFVIDTSGSMGGVSIDQARQSLLMALSTLRPQDSFNIIEFSSRHRALFPGAVPATRHDLQTARDFVQQLSAGGGTEMLPALRAALAGENAYRDDSSDRATQARVRQVIFITDGAIGNEEQLFEEIAKTLGNSRLFTVGIGSAPNSWFMRKAAQIGRGTHVHIGDLREVAGKMQALFDQISTPLVLDIQIGWPGSVEAYPQRVPDLFAGQPVLVAFKFEGEQHSKDIEVSGQTLKKPWSRRLQLQDLSASSDHSSDYSKGVASIWAREKIATLLDQKLMGADEEQVRAAVLEVALEHHLMSPYTSFVAVEERISRAPGIGVDKASVPNLQPRGQSPQMVSYPATATTGRANLFLGGLMLFLAMMTYVMRQPEVDCDSRNKK